MRLLSRFSKRPFEIPGTSLVLEKPGQQHMEKWIEVRRESYDFLRPWEPTWPKDDLTSIGFRRRLNAYNRHRLTGWGQTFFLIDQESGKLIGGISLTKISHGISGSATLGYWMGVHHADKGTMQLVVPAILRYAFTDLRLNRVEAACLPKNARSIHLLEKCGFSREGYARKFLEINGQREDHVLFAVLKSDVINHGRESVGWKRTLNWK